MKILLREYQSVLIALLGAMLALSAVFLIVPSITGMGKKDENYFLQVIKQDTVKKTVVYPKGQRLSLSRGEYFNINEYYELKDDQGGNINVYSYVYVVNGVKLDEFNTNECGCYTVDVRLDTVDNMEKLKFFVTIEEE